LRSGWDSSHALDAGNSARIPGINTALGGGGGLRIGGPATVSGCTFSGNSATGFTFPFGPHLPGSGGAIYNNWSNNFNPLTVTVRDSNFDHNSAELGGAIYNAGYGLAVSGCTFSSNSAVQGGGIYNAAGATLDVRGSTFTGNTASISGGGIYNAAAGTLTVKDCKVLNNAAPSGADIKNLGALTLDNNTVGVIGP
jgi:predicted outer membrane repeat protein